MWGVGWEGEIEGGAGVGETKREVGGGGKKRLETLISTRQRGEGPPVCFSHKLGRCGERPKGRRLCVATVALPWTLSRANLSDPENRHREGRKSK